MWNYSFVFTRFLKRCELGIANVHNDNLLDSYKKWEDIVGAGRILPAFPGAGGSINADAR